MSITVDDRLLGCYVRPKDSSPDPDAVHRREGFCWAFRDDINDETGEWETLIRVVRTSRGRVSHSVLAASDVGTADPPNRASLRTLVRLLHTEAAKGLGPLGDHHARTLECIVALSRVAS